MDITNKRLTSSPDFIAKILPYVAEDGARNLLKIARDLSIPYESLRFRMMRLKEIGLSIVPIPDFEKLGLERVRAFMKLPSATKDMKALFGGLHQSAGLKIYSRSVHNHLFDCEFAIPKGTLTELERLLLKLEEMKIILNPELKRMLWKEVFVLKAESFDYPAGEWDVDFSRLVGNPSTVQIPGIQGKEMTTKNNKNFHIFDYNDLFMVKEIEADPWIKNIDLSKKLKISFEDSSYHLNKHVFGKKLIKNFRLRWTGTKDAWLKHSIIALTYIFRNTSAETARHAMSILTAMPFTWSCTLTEDGTLFAEVLFPVSLYMEGIQHVSNELRALDLTPEVLVRDWSCSSTFTIPYLLYNRDQTKWEFNAEHALEYTMQMIKSCSN